MVEAAGPQRIGVEVAAAKYVEVLAPESVSPPTLGKG